MELNLKDLTSNANNLTNNGATDITSSLPPSFVGANHAAQVASVSSQYLTAADANQISIVTTGQMTWEFWCKVNTLNNNNNVLWKGVGSNYEYQIIVGDASGKLTATAFSLDGNVRYNNASVASAIATGSWKHIAASIDNTLAWATSNLKIYIDETESTSTTAGGSSFSLGNGTANLDIGRRTDTSAYGDFQIMDLRIWNTIRTTTQLSTYKNQFLTGAESGLVAYYPFGYPPSSFGKSININQAVHRASRW